MKKFYYSLIISNIIFLSLYPIWMELTLYLHPLVIGVVWLCINLVGLFVGLLLAKKTIKLSKKLLHANILIYTLALLVLLFFRPNSQVDTMNLVPFETIQFYFSGHVDFIVAFYNLAANIALFIPFGIYYGYIARRPIIFKLIGLTFLGITFIELTQYITGRGTFDIDDLILNTIGTTLGLAIYPLSRKVLQFYGGVTNDLKREA